MFRFEEGRMYQMPVHFGPCCTPRQDPEGKRFCSYGPQESALHTLVCQTEGAAVERFLPEGFSLRRPYLFFTHKMHRNLPWLAGRGYNVVTCNVPVTGHLGEPCRPHPVRTGAAGVFQALRRDRGSACLSGRRLRRAVLLGLSFPGAAL